MLLLHESTAFAGEAKGRAVEGQKPELNPPLDRPAWRAIELSW
jgi:hypothetical protein